jgi:hypothetical protein
VEYLFYFILFEIRTNKIDGTRTCHAQQWPTPPSRHSLSVMGGDDFVDLCPSPSRGFVQKMLGVLLNSVWVQIIGISRSVERA